MDAPSGSKHRMYEPSHITSEPPADLPALVVPENHPAGRNEADHRRRRWSWRLSRWVHGLALGLVAAEWLAGIPLSPLVPPQQQGEQVKLAAVLEPATSPPPLVTLTGLEDPRPNAAAIAAEEIARQTRESAPELARELLDPGAASATASAWLQQRMQEEVAAAEQLPVEDQQQRLAQLGEKLEQISSADSVAAVNHRLNSLFGTSGRATQPAAEPVAGEFDYDTAQLHDVKRTENNSGGYDYTAVLLDAAGRTMESALDEAEGAQLFKTFQIIKSNPLLERVYRGVVMSLFDKLMRQQAPATPAAPQRESP